MTLSPPAVSVTIFVSHNEENIGNEDEVHDARPDPADRLIDGESGENIKNALSAHFSTM